MLSRNIRRKPPTRKKASLQPRRDLSANQAAATALQDRMGNHGVRSFLSSIRNRYRISQVHDQRERQADAVAKNIASSTLSPEDIKTPQKASVDEGMHNVPHKQSTPDANNPMGSAGRPLDAELQAQMEARFNQDFSAVRIHDGSAAHSAAQALGAEAFTSGSHIGFAKGLYRPHSLQGTNLLAHELAHVVQQRQHAGAGLPAIQLKRAADVVYQGHYSFYLTQGESREFAVQFYYSGTGNTVSIKVAHQPSATMRQGCINLPDGAIFNPVITVDGETTTLFDLDGDGMEEVAVQAVVDDYREEFLTAETTPTSPDTQWYDIRDIYVVATWGAGGRLTFEIPGRPPPHAIAPPVWQMRSHVHPLIGLVWFNNQTGAYVIPPIGGYSLSSSGREGPPPYFRLSSELESLATEFTPSPAGVEAVADPFAVAGPAQEGSLTLAHESLRAMASMGHDEVSDWGASDAIWWKTRGGQQYLYAYKDRWVRGYRNAIRAAADTYDIPRVLLAGVAWVEVGGDPDWFDDVAYALRGAEGELTTSIAPMSMQVRRAATELGYDPETMTDAQRDAVLNSLKDPQQAIFIAARHLATLRDVDFAGRSAGDLGAEEIAVIAKRYNIGPDIPLAQVRLNLDYGIAILRRGQRLLNLLEAE